MKELLFCVMGSSPDIWISHDRNRKTKEVLLFKDRNSTEPDSEDEIGKYKARWFCEQREYKDVSNNCDPYLMQFELI